MRIEEKTKFVTVPLEDVVAEQPFVFENELTVYWRMVPQPLCDPGQIGVTPAMRGAWKLCSGSRRVRVDATPRAPFEFPEVALQALFTDDDMEVVYMKVTDEVAVVYDAPDTQRIGSAREFADYHDVESVCTAVFKDGVETRTVVDRGNSAVTYNPVQCFLVENVGHHLYREL